MFRVACILISLVVLIPSFVFAENDAKDRICIVSVIDDKGANPTLEATGYAEALVTEEQDSAMVLVKNVSVRYNARQAHYQVSVPAGVLDAAEFLRVEVKGEGRVTTFDLTNDTCEGGITISGGKRGDTCQGQGSNGNKAYSGTHLKGDVVTGKKEFPTGSVEGPQKAAAVRAFTRQLGISNAATKNLCEGSCENSSEGCSLTGIGDVSSDGVDIRPEPVPDSPGNSRYKATWLKSGQAGIYGMNCDCVEPTPTPGPNTGLGPVGDPEEPGETLNPQVP